MKKESYALKIFFISLSLLMFEISIIRLLSVIVFSNFAFLGISAALFGLALGGLIVYLFIPQEHDEKKLRRLLLYTLIAYGISVAIFIVTILNVKLSQGGLLLLFTLLASLPFALGNIFITLVFRRYTWIIDRLYFSDLIGAGSGVLVALICMNVTSAINVILITACIAFIVSLTMSHGRQRMVVSIVLVLFAGFILYNHTTNVLDIVYAKGSLEQQRIFSKWNTFSRISLHEPTTGRMHSLSGNEDIKPVERYGILIDGDAYTPALFFDGNLKTVDYLRHDLSSIAYQLRDKGSTLIIGAGGGRDILSALIFGHRVTGIEINPIIGNFIVQGYLKEFNSDLYNFPGVVTHIAEGRSFVARDTNSYDVINIPLVDTWASTAAGNLVLVESNLYTVEAFKNYIDRLNAGGILSLSRWELDGARLISLYRAATESMGLGDISRNVAILGNTDQRGVQLNNYLFKTSAFRDEEISAIQVFAADNGFSLPYLPGSETNEFPYTKLLAGSDIDVVAHEMDRNILPVTDDSPFYFFQTPLNRIFLPNKNFLDGGLGMSLIILVLLTIFTIFIPRISMSRTITKYEKDNLPWYLGYFASLGLAFILIELALIQKFILYLEQPIYSFSVVITAILISAGFGSSISKRFAARRSASYGTLSLVVVAIIGVYSLLLPYSIRLTLSSSLSIKIILTIVLVAVPSVFMGMFLPLGFRRLEREGLQSLVPWCWAVNGALSVLGSILALYGAILFGFSVVLITGASLYILAFFFMLILGYTKKRKFQT